MIPKLSIHKKWMKLRTLANQADRGEASDSEPKII